MINKNILSFIVLILIIILIIILAYMLIKLKETIDIVNNSTIDINKYLQIFNKDICGIDEMTCPREPIFNGDVSRCIPSCDFINMATYTCNINDDLANNSICNTIKETTF